MCQSSGPNKDTAERLSIRFGFRLRHDLVLFQFATTLKHYLLLFLIIFCWIVYLYSSHRFYLSVCRWWWCVGCVWANRDPNGRPLLHRTSSLILSIGEGGIFEKISCRLEWRERLGCGRVIGHHQSPSGSPQTLFSPTKIIPGYFSLGFFQLVVALFVIINVLVVTS